MQIEPGLSGQVRVAGWCKVDGFANAYLTGIAYRRALIEAGVMVLEQVSARGIEPENGGYKVVTTAGYVRGSRLVIAGGVWIEPMLAWPGVHLPIKVLTNQLSVTERITSVMRTQVGIASGLLSLKQFPHGTVVIGGGWQGTGSRDLGYGEIVAENVISNIRLACHAIPALAVCTPRPFLAGLEAGGRRRCRPPGPSRGYRDAFVAGSVHSGSHARTVLASCWSTGCLSLRPARTAPVFEFEPPATRVSNTPTSQMDTAP